jgi:hypothetical protein
MLFDNIDKDIQDARKTNNKDLLKTLQDIKVELTKIKTSKNAKEITEEVEINLIKKMFNECSENYQTFKEAGRDDLANDEYIESTILASYLPPEANEEDIVSVIRELSNNTMAIDKKEMAYYIKSIKSKFKNVDGKLVADTVKKYIQQ